MARQQYLVLGIAIALLGAVYPSLLDFLTTVVIDTAAPQFYASASYPASKDIDVPSIITQIGTATDFWILARDVGSGITLTEIRCTSTDGTYDSGVVACIGDGDITLGGDVWEVWKWEAPTLTAGKLYKFHWTAQDKAGKTSSIDTYGIHSDADGYFTLNGVEITDPEQTVILGSRTLDIQFHATKAALGIVSITVKVKTQAGIVLKSEQLTQVDENNWDGPGFYTFASDGTYTIEGYIDMATKSLLKMSIVQQIGEGKGLLSFDLVQLVMIALGGLTCIYGIVNDDD